MHLVLALLGALRAGLGARTDLVLENLAQRQQLALLRRRSKRPRFGPLDRLFWIWLSQRWARWRETLNVVRPETVIRWQLFCDSLSAALEGASRVVDAFQIEFWPRTMAESSRCPRSADFITATSAARRKCDR